jgi:hypothetical protein
MGNRKGGDLEAVFLENQTFFDGDQFYIDWRAMASQNDAEEEIVDTFKGPSASPDLQAIDGFPAHESGKQPRQTEDVIEMPVGDQDPVETPKSDPRLQDLALRSLTTIDQEPVISITDDLRG